MIVVACCPCGKEINSFPSRKGRKKYCSKDCFYNYRKRPSGLSYNIVVKNKGWYEKGNKPWNQGKRGEFKGKTIDALHDWVYRNFGKPIICEKCGSYKNLQWSNKSEEYEIGA